MEAAQRSEGEGKMRVLVVEDNKFNQKMLKQMLNVLDCTVRDLIIEFHCFLSVVGDDGE